MDDSYAIIIIVGAIALVSSVIGGYRLAQIQSRYMKPIRLIGTLIILVLVAIFVYYELQDGIPIQHGNPPTAIPPTIETVRIETLDLNQTATYALNLDEKVALTYAGELGQVVTLTISPETGTSPTVTMSSQVGDNPPVVDRSIRARGKQTIVCGYLFNVNATYTFLFQATDTTNYTVEFAEGNTCQGD